MNILESIKKTNKDLYNELRFWFSQNPKYKEFDLEYKLLPAKRDHVMMRKIVQVLVRTKGINHFDQGIAISIFFDEIDLHQNNKELYYLIEEKLKLAVDFSHKGLQDETEEPIKRILYLYAEKFLKQLNPTDIFEKLIV